MADGTLGRLITDLGERSTYDAASQCSRCGYCEQDCPTYVVTGRETHSARGRNQLARMLLEGGLKDPSSAVEALDSCLLCGACTAACYAHVRTADLVLEARRAVSAGRVPWLARRLTWLLESRPDIFARILRAAYALKRWGVSKLAGDLRLLRLAGLVGMEAADRQIRDLPKKFLFEELRGDPEMKARSEEFRWAYFAPCGPNYLLPRVGRATVAVLRKTLGPGRFMDNPCCGLLAYNYGSVEAAKRFAKLNIARWETVGALTPALSRQRERAAGEFRGVGGPILVGDCSSCVAHLKLYPQLFLDEPEWRARADKFSRAVRDIVEISATVVPLPEDLFPGAATYHDSCRCRNGQGVVSAPRASMRTLFGERFVEIPEPQWCCGGAGAFAFTQTDLSDEVLRRKIGYIAQVQARVVATSSTSCLLQLVHGLKKYYPECRAFHLSELAAQALLR